MIVICDLDASRIVPRSSDTLPAESNVLKGINISSIRFLPTESTFEAFLLNNWERTYLALISKLANFSLKYYPERSRRTECRAASKPEWNKIPTLLLRCEAVPTVVVRAGEDFADILHC